MGSEEEDARIAAAEHPWYWRLKGELEITFRRALKEAADAIFVRLDRAEVERREERRDIEVRVGALEQRVPKDLQEQLQKLRSDADATKTTGRLLVTIIGFVLTAITIVLGILALTKPGGG